MNNNIKVHSFIKSGMSVDVEDAINIDMQKYFYIEIPPTLSVVDNVLRLLNLFSEKKTSATFFLLGEVADKYPTLVKKIAKDGHEIGVHGYKHTRLDNISLETAKNEIERAKKSIEDISGKQIFGYRAPFFSVNEKSSWIFEVLGELGFKYDSSDVNNCFCDYYENYQNSIIKKIKLSNNNFIVEIPPSTYSIFGHTLPICGGGYLRILPFCYTKALLKKTKKPVIVYTHPYEIDIATPPVFYQKRLECASIKTKLLIKKSNFNRKRLFHRLNYLLENYEFTSIINLINEIN